MSKWVSLMEQHSDPFEASEGRLQAIEELLNYACFESIIDEREHAELMEAWSAADKSAEDLFDMLKTLQEIQSYAALFFEI